jgi:hypothetical protein
MHTPYCVYKFVFSIFLESNILAKTIITGTMITGNVDAN